MDNRECLWNIVKAAAPRGAAGARRRRASGAGSGMTRPLVPPGIRLRTREERRACATMPASIPRERAALRRQAANPDGAGISARVLWVARPGNWVNVMPFIPYFTNCIRFLTAGTVNMTLPAVFYHKSSRIIVNEKLSEAVDAETSCRIGCYGEIIPAGNCRRRRRGRFARHDRRPGGRELAGPLRIALHIPGRKNTTLMVTGQ